MPKKKRTMKFQSLKCKPSRIRGVDLFCGVGGLTRGLEAAGIEVSLGVDIDPACEYSYTKNNDASFLLKPVEKIKGSDLSNIFDGTTLNLLAGCAPCQPFSTYTQGKNREKDERWKLLTHFARLVRETKPELVTMENVPRIRHENVFKRFISVLGKNGYFVFHDIVDCADYGVPQRRKRLVLLASKLGPIELIGPTTLGKRRGTVRKAIGKLPRLKSGESCPTDPLHHSNNLSALNMKRIKASKPGGTWRDWDKRLRADCHKKSSGKTYPSVYGRMSWDEPSPAITTQFYNFGTGRFGHPTQNRALSIREGAILQSFPRSYKFVEKDEPINVTVLSRLIGNAVPVKLGKAIGESINLHVESTLSARGK
jgi:DNA (cytosine-5)-methyltransferase 1